MGRAVSPAGFPLALLALLAVFAGCSDPPPPPSPPPPGGMARGLAPDYAPPFEAADAPEVFEARQRLDLATGEARRQLADALGPLALATTHATVRAEGWAPIQAYYDSVLAGWDSGGLDVRAPATAAWWRQGPDAFVVVHVPATDSVAYMHVLRPAGR